jgi:hypothetical protein
VNEVGSILQILPRASPGRDGVGDYARTLASKLAQHHSLTTVFISAIGGNDLVVPSAAAAKERKDDRYAAIVLHYVNYGYSRKGVPLWLPPALHRLQQSSDAPQITVFHELYASGASWRQSAFWLRPLQVRVARSIALLSDSCIVSSEVARQQLARLAPKTRINVHPVFSNFGEPTLSSHEIAQRDPHRWIICGGTELVERSLRSFLAVASLIPERFAPHDLSVVGGSDNPVIRQMLEGETKIRTQYRPQVEANVASQLLAEVAFGWMDYFHQQTVPMPLILKSTTFAAYCAHGVIPVLPHSGAVVALGSDALPGPFFVATSESHVPAESDRAAIAGLFYQWYERNAASGQVAASIKAAVCERR